MFGFIETRCQLTMPTTLIASLALAVAFFSTASAQEPGPERIERFEADAASTQSQAPLRVIQVRQLRIQQSGFIPVANRESGELSAIPVRITRRITMVRISPVDPAAVSRAQGIAPGSGMQQAAFRPAAANTSAPTRKERAAERTADGGSMFSLSQIRPRADESSAATGLQANAEMIARVRLGEDRREWQAAQQTGFHPSKANGSLWHGLDWLGDITGIEK